MQGLMSAEATAFSIHTLVCAQTLFFLDALRTSSAVLLFTSSAYALVCGLWALYNLMEVRRRPNRSLGSPDPTTPAQPLI
jgi:hypothetical protein